LSNTIILTYTKDESSGDGTSSFIILTTELLQRAKTPIKEGSLHFDDILEGYRTSAQFSVSVIDEISFPLHKETHLTSIAATCGASKVRDNFHL
jgi:chaperonin GroEL (HSP60 family)